MAKGYEVHGIKRRASSFNTQRIDHIYEDPHAPHPKLKLHYGEGKDDLLNSYSDDCLDRVWKASRFSWWMTTLFHKLSDNPFNRKIQQAELEYLVGSKAGQTTIAENFVGLD